MNFLEMVPLSWSQIWSINFYTNGGTKRISWNSFMHQEHFVYGQQSDQDGHFEFFWLKYLVWESQKIVKYLFVFAGPSLHRFFCRPRDNFIVVKLAYIHFFSFVSRVFWHTNLYNVEAWRKKIKRNFLQPHPSFFLKAL